MRAWKGRGKKEEETMASKKKNTVTGARGGRDESGG